MGNKENKHDRAQGHGIQRKKKTEISPYREGLSAYTQSPLVKFIKSSNQFNVMDPMGNGNEVNVENFEDNEEFEQKEIEKLEKKYFFNAPEEFQAIKKDFEAYSKENKMAKRKLLDYFGLLSLDTTKFGNRFFNCVKGTSKQQTNIYLDFVKFLRAICMLSKNAGDERLRFIYSIFDLDCDGYIEKDEMLNIFMSFYDAMSQIEFENQDLMQLKNKIGESHEQQIALAIQDIVNEIYENYQTKPGILFYEEWKKWIECEPGMKEILTYNFNDSKVFK